MKKDVIIWDHKEQFPDAELNYTLDAMGINIRVKYVNTNADHYGLVVTELPVSDEEAQNIYNEFEREMSEEKPDDDYKETPNLEVAMKSVIGDILGVEDLDNSTPDRGGINEDSNPTGDQKGSP